MRAQENKCPISQNDTLHMKFTEFCLCFHKSCEILHWCYFFFSDELYL